MPPSSEQPPSHQQPAVDFNSFYQEEASRKPSPGRKGQGKNRKRHEYAAENLEKERSFRGISQEMTSPRSILSQLHASTSSPQASPNGVSSPGPEAWNAAPTKTHSESPQSTTEWATNIPFGRSPPQAPSNGVSVSMSPPRYRPPLEEDHGGFLHTSPPTSPRAAYRQPIHRPNEYQSFGDYHGSSPNNRRPLSLNSQNSHYPPPPHHPQAHFYGAPEVDFGLSRPPTEDRMPSEGHCYVFDTLPSSSPEASRCTEDVMLVGFGHGLNVCHIDKKRFDRIGRLEGLRGSVIGAKLLPSQQGDDRGLQPLVAVVVHGPYVPSVPTSRPGTSHAPDEEFDPSGSMLQVLHTADVLYYQTTVEIYSLRKGIHIATVFRSPKVDVKNSRFGAHPVMPSPIGDLKVQAKGKFVVVSSGTSGEVFILESFRTECSEISIAFKCIGKVWTRTLPRKSRSVSTSSSESGHDGLHDALATVTRQTDSAILSLSPRWLAFVPPASSEQTTLHGEIVSEGPSQKAPGLSSHASPAEPQVSCDLDAPEAESLFNKAARDITQGVLKTAQWVGAEGRQAWSNYWSRPSEQHRQTPTGSPPPHEQQSFPPTHAQDSLPNRARNQPALVSVLDLEKLSKAQHFKSTNALQPLATFSAPSGCSLLSFSPSGVHLLTASAKGDVQHVWDLKRMVHGEAGHPGDPNASLKGPSVRQVAKITRMTEARIVDVVWMEPKDERLAIITDRGTVHINDIPFSAFLWPPPRRVARNAAASYKSSAPGAANDASGCPGSAGTGNTFTSAFGMFAGKTQPLLDAVRGRRTSTGGGGFPGFSGMAVTAGLGAKSGRAVAAGFNKSVGAAASGTVNTIRHLGENRLVLPGSLNVVSPGCVRWLCGKDHGHIAVSGGGIVRIYSVRQSNNAKAGQRRPSVVGDRPAEFKLPNEPMPSQHALSNQQLNARPFPERSTVGGSFWLPPPSASISRRSNMNTYPLSYAELDHTSGYQPFHTDRRVNLYVYNQDPTSSDTHPLENKNACVFGEAIPSTKVSVGTAAHEEGDMDAGQPAPEAQMENIISMKGNAEEGQQVVVTTRRKRQKNGVGASVGENEIFEDDCEVLDFAEERV